MNIIRKILFSSFIILLTSCANYKYDKETGKFIPITPQKKKEKIYYSSKGFALIYEKSLFKDGIINKKIDEVMNNEQILIMHSLLKKNTPIKIINPKNSKVIESKIYRKATYHKIFNVAISKKVAKILELDLNNPYVEIFEFKKNKTFIAEEGTIFDEEKKVFDTAPVDKIKMDDLTKEKVKTKKEKFKKDNFVLVIADFYYFESAKKLEQKLIEQTKINNFKVKKMHDNKYRLSSGPFKNFNSLKSTYISLNNLGFDDLNIYNE